MDDQINMQIDFLQDEVDNLEQECEKIIKKKEYKIQIRRDPFTEYSDTEFRRRFRLSKVAVRYLYDLIGADLEPLVVRESFTISGLDKILVTLRYFASASFQIVVGDFYGVSEASVCNIIPLVSNKIASLSRRFIQMPHSDAQIEKAKRDFFRMAGMPSIIGAIDGTLIKIQEVGGIQNKTAFYCRKQFYALNTQVIVDADDRIIDIVARWPGSTHDETIFLNSIIFERFLNGEFVRNGRDSILLGDGGYRAERFLAVPLRENRNQPKNRVEAAYQKAHIATRQTVEKVFGQWKRRFPCLWIGMKFRKLETVQNVIIATAVLHNLCKEFGDLTPPELTPQQQVVYNTAMDQERQFLQANNNERARNLPTTIRNELLRNYFEIMCARQ